MYDKDKLGIRPEINSIDESLNSSSFENFQNTVLRPILKLQNNLIIEFFNNYLKSKKLDINTINKNDLLLNIERLIKKDNSFTLELRTLVIACFTTDEYHIYIDNKKDFNKRITSMTIQRITDNLKNY